MSLYTTISGYIGPFLPPCICIVKFVQKQVTYNLITQASYPRNSQPYSCNSITNERISKLLHLSLHYIQIINTLIKFLAIRLLEIISVPCRHFKKIKSKQQPKNFIGKLRQISGTLTQTMSFILLLIILPALLVCSWNIGMYPAHNMPLKLDHKMLLICTLWHLKY